jgi:hypothetical protein
MCALLACLSHQTLFFTYGHLSPPLQHSIFGASLGLFYQVMSSLPFFAFSALLSYLSHHKLHFIHGPLSPSLLQNIFSTTLALLYQVYHPVLSLHLLPCLLTFPTRRLLLCITTTATQQLRRQFGLVLPSTSSRSFFASSALLSYLSHQTLPFIHGPLSPPLRHNIFSASLGLVYRVCHPVLSLYLLPYFLTFPHQVLTFMHGPLSPPLQHNIFGARLGLVYQV